MNLKMIFSTGALLLLSGCSIESSITALVSELLVDGSSTEMTSGSVQGVYSSQGYEVQASLSYHYVPPQLTTAQGYTVNGNLQSMIFKE